MNPISILALQQTLGIGLKTVEKILSLPDIQEPASPYDLIKLIKMASAKYNKITIPDIKAATIGWNKAQEIIKMSQQHNIQIISKDSIYYPNCLSKISDPPVLLHVKGNIDILKKDCIAIVGTRKPTEFGRNQAKEIGGIFAKEGYVVVSGLAEGVDSSAHMGALEVKGLTIAVLAHGLDMIYPAKNKQLAETILNNNGALISEYPLGTRIFRNYFVERDRIQSGLSLGVFVIETGVKGGTMHTVRFCEKQKRALIVLQHPKNLLENSKPCGNTQLIAEKRANIVYETEFNTNFIKDTLNNKKEELLAFKSPNQPIPPITLEGFAESKIMNSVDELSQVSSPQKNPPILFGESVQPILKDKKNTKPKNYLFSWNEIPGNDNDQLIKFLKKNYGVPWVKVAKIEKIDNGKTISVSNKENSLLLTLNNDKNKAILTINTTDEFIVKKENGNLNICLKKTGINSKDEKIKDLHDFGVIEQ